jgi:hypothetical protein
MVAPSCLSLQNPPEQLPSKRESLEYINLLQTLDHLAARKDQRREPVEGNERARMVFSWFGP